MTIHNDSQLPQSPDELRHRISELETTAAGLSADLMETSARLEATRMALLVAENLASTPEALRVLLREKVDFNSISSGDDASFLADILIHEARIAPIELHPVYAEYIGLLAIRFHLHTHDSEDESLDEDDEGEPERFQC